MIDNLELGGLTVGLICGFIIGFSTYALMHL